MVESLARWQGDAWSRAWEMRLVERLPLPPLAVGVLAALALITLYVVVELVLEGSVLAAPGPAGFSEPFLGFATAALVTGYALAAGFAINAGNARALDELRSRLQAAAESTGAGLATSRWWGVLGVLAGLAFISVIDPVAWQVVSQGRFSGDGVLSLLLVPLPFWLFARAAYFTLTGVRAIARHVEEGLGFDLLDPTALVPLGHVALRGTLLWIGAGALGSLSIVLTGGSIPEFAAVAFLLLVAAASFVLPVRGVRRRVREAKAVELARTRAELRDDHAALRAGGPGAAEAAARLPALLAWEARIEAVREWPFDTPTLVRFSLYLLIPLGSWLGGALVERSIDALLD